MFKKIVGLGFFTRGKNAKDIEKYISDLVAGGANEFFVGYNPPYWHEKFGFEVSPNGRFAEHEQITDFESLKLITKEVHKHNLEIFANLNAWYYTEVTMPYIKQMVEEFEEIGIDGIICGNIGILEYLKSIDYKGKINISTIIALYNSEAIRFFLENYKINRVILSRELTLKEIEDIVKAFPETKFEVFGEGDFCRYNNGLCFAEHKYSSKDICTVVVNDLIFKKKFKPDFKRIILDDSLTELEKVQMFDDKFDDIFDRISDILAKIDLHFEDEGILKEELLKIYKNSKDRVDLFFDGMQGPDSKKNKKILVYLRGLNYVIENCEIKESKVKTDLLNLREELKKSIKTGMDYFFSKVKSLSGEPKLKALQTKVFYARGDNLNLYSYLFFSRFPNIDTVKFPTRGRSYDEKIRIIEDTIANNKVKDEYLDRGISLERAHYDLTHLFGDKLRFRKMLADKF